MMLSEIIDRLIGIEKTFGDFEIYDAGMTASLTEDGKVLFNAAWNIDAKEVTSDD